MRSARLDWNRPENALAALAARAAARGDLLDLTESNPTRVGLAYPTEALGAALARTRIAPYEPAPLGLPAARAAVAADYGRAGFDVAPAQLVLTASSSESYAFLFKLGCDPGDAVLVPEPSYPLFEYLAHLEGVVPIGYRLGFDGVWHVDFGSLGDALERARQAGHRPRAIVVVNPNNPTGSFVKRDELGRLGTLATREDLALLSDEVFAPYPAGPDENRVSLLATAPEVESVRAVFSLGGLSKASGLPQLKLGWIVVGGREAAATLKALELIADTYLSVGTPVQAAAADLLALGAGIRVEIAARVARNRRALAAALASAPRASTLLPAEGGFAAILRIPATRSDEAWAASLLTEASVLVHPGYFFDLAGGTFLVASLLPEPSVFDRAIGKLLTHLDGGAR